MSDEWCAHGPSRNCKDCEIERLEAELKEAYAEIRKINEREGFKDE